MDRVCHFEIPYAEKDRAQEFYRNVFGWDIADVPGLPEEYSLVTTTPMGENYMPKEPGGINGGMYRRSEGICTTPVVVIQVDSCEGRVNEVEAAGGSVVQPPTKTGEMGIYAQVKDPEDNIIGLWQPLGPG